ncbi:MAG: hypothetical protein HAW60_05635, partial [Bdellovibrionales bacterium]|nr:hypothetical protein [Bdellovibrionales bacterium]
MPYKKLNNKGASIISAMMLALVTSISIGIISSQVPWGYKFGLNINANIEITKLLEYTSKFVVVGIKNRLCFDRNLKKATPCKLTSTRNTERILLDDDVSNPESNFFNFKKMIIANNDSVTGREALEEMGLPIKYADIEKIFLDKISFDSISIKDSPLAEIFAAVSGVDFNALKIIIKRDKEYIRLDRESSVILTIELTAKIQGKPEKTYVMESKNIFFPRELNSFALISGRDLWLGKNSDVPSAGTIEGESDVCKPSSTTDSLINLPTTTTQTKAIVFQSPVYINGNVHLPTSNTKIPVSFSSLVLGGGKLKVLSGNYNPDFSKGFKYKDSIGSIFKKVQVEKEDKGLKVLSGQEACKNASLATCDGLEEAKITLGKMKVEGRPNVAGGYLSVPKGFYHSCAITSAGKLKCWGRNNYRQADVPTGKFDTGTRSVSEGEDHTCAITAIGK